MSDVPARVHYYDEQYLRTQDFVEEQAYHIAAHRRHNIAQHGWGIVTGLELVDDDGSVWVQPGVGIDGFGRELVLAHRRPLAGSAFADKGSDTLEVWLAYDRAGTDTAPPGYADCDEEGTRPFYRWQEEPLLILQVPDPEFPDRRRPQDVTVQDVDFPPYLDPPDDPARYFPLFLGQVTRGARPEDPPQIDLAGRPYVGLVGEGVVGPSGRVAVQIGAQDETDENRFAVYVAGTDPTVPRFALRTDGTARIEGETTISGDLTLRGGAAEFQPGTAGSPAAPWRVYHAHDAAQDIHELRVQMARPAPGGATGTNQVVIGSWRKAADETGTESEAFHPCLTVSDDGTVTVHGNLVVTGSIVAEAEAAAELSDEAKRFIGSSLLTGIGGAGSLIDRVFKGPLAPGGGGGPA